MNRVNVSPSFHTAYIICASHHMRIRELRAPLEGGGVDAVARAAHPLDSSSHILYSTVL